MRSLTNNLTKIFSVITLTMLISLSGNKEASAQLEVSTGVDLVSTYVWRGWPILVHLGNLMWKQQLET